MIAGWPLLVGSLLATSTSEPSPTDDPGFTIYNVTPGISGFIAFFLLAVAGWLLFRSLTKHMRRVDRAREQREGADDVAGTQEPGPHADAEGPSTSPAVADPADPADSGDAPGRDEVDGEPGRGGS